jgi:hypothetical protein
MPNVVHLIHSEQGEKEVFLLLFDIDKNNQQITYSITGININ